MNLSLTPETESFLKVFFGSGNELKWEAICNGSLPKENQIFLETAFSEINEKKPAVLPREICKKGLHWYAIGFAPEHIVRIHEELRAFVGPTHAYLNEGTFRLDPEDKVEKAISDFCGIQDAFYFKVCADNESKKIVRFSLDLMRKVNARRPKDLGFEVRSTGRLIRDFDLALALKHFDEADSILNQLDDVRLSIFNRIFLRIKYRVAKGDYKNVFMHPELKDQSSLLAIRLPREICRDLRVAIFYNELLNAFNDPVKTLEVFENKIALDYSSIFRGDINPGDRKESLFMRFLYELNQTPRHVMSRVDNLREILKKDFASDDFLSELIRLKVGNTTEITSVATEVAQTHESPLQLAFAKHDWQAIIELPATTEPAFDYFSHLLIANHLLDTSEAMLKTWSVYQQLPDELKTRVSGNKSLQKALAFLLENEPTTKPDSWESWFRQLKEKDDWPQAVQIAREESQVWVTEDYLNNSQKVKEIATFLLEKWEPKKNQVINLVVPTLVEFFFTLPPNEAFRDFYQSLLFRISVSDNISSLDRELFLKLTETLSEIGLSKDAMADLADWFREIWNLRKGPHLFSWALDVIEMLTFYGFGNYDAVKGIFSIIESELLKYSSELTSVQRGLLKILCKRLDYELNSSFNIQEVESQEIKADLQGKTLGIYTLSEKSGERAKETLESEYPGLKVITSNDHVASEHLHHMIKVSDYMVITYLSAKHAATYYITDNWKNKPPIIYPGGTGHSSIIDSFKKVVEKTV